MIASKPNSQTPSEQTAPPRFHGTYRGIVENNADPMQLGRILASVPSVSSAEVLNWAMPCTPFPAAAPSLSVPPLGTCVWIEFEGGDLAYPIWSGCFWTAGQTPLLQSI